MLLTCLSRLTSSDSFFYLVILAVLVVFWTKLQAKYARLGQHVPVKHDRSDQSFISGHLGLTFPVKHHRSDQSFISGFLGQMF